jgi:hypothetical protein
MATGLGIGYSAGMVALDTLQQAAPAIDATVSSLDVKAFEAALDVS